MSAAVSRNTTSGTLLGHQKVFELVSDASGGVQCTNRQSSVLCVAVSSAGLHRKGCTLHPSDIQSIRAVEV